MTTRWKIILFLFLLATALIWIAIFTFPNNRLRIIACDVGQGDAFLIIQASKQIIVDGGPNGSFVECLGRHLPFWDRSIDTVVMTHPQADHFKGLIGVFQHYSVEFFLSSSVDASIKDYQVLKSLVGGAGTKVINPDSRTTIHIGEITLDFVNPVNEENKQVLGSFTTTEDLNDFSVVFNMHYGDFDALFTGDIGPAIMDEVIATGEIQDIEYLKVPHHGSKNGLTQELLNSSKPDIAVISSGKKNNFGHPHKQVLEMLQSIKTLRTDELGDVVVETDGKSWWVIN